jgi:adenylate cyclase
MSATRRLAAILAADVVGYSRLMGEDEAGTAQSVRESQEAARPIIRTHGGRIVKTMGDGVLVEFPSMVAAVECAIAIQKLMVERNVDVPNDKRIVYRMGVHLGDVIVDGDDILGDGVNIAARLEGIAEPNGICLSASAHEHVQGRIDARFVDLGEKELKNIARPVRVYAITPSEAPLSARLPSKTDQESGVAGNHRDRLASPNKPSIAVLPFQNMSGDPEQDYFADGVVEDITTGLSRLRWLLVIARNSSFVYKGKAVDVRQVGRELGVQYVLEGSVRKAGTRVRITAQLVAAEDGAHLWADKYDGALEDVFDLQDEITDRVVGVVEPKLRVSEFVRSRRKRPENLDAYDLWLRSFPYQSMATLDDIKNCEGLLSQALKIDPNFAQAHLGIAWSHLRKFQFGLQHSNKISALESARRAITLAPDDPDILARAALPILWLAKDAPYALELIERALSANSSSAYAHFFGAIVHAYNGHSQKAFSLAERALRLSPFDRITWIAHEARGIAAFGDTNYGVASAWFARETEANPTFFPAYLLQASAMVFDGQIDMARSVSERALQMAPNFRLRLIPELIPTASMVQKLTEAGRKLGLPE